MDDHGGHTTASDVDSQLPADYSHHDKASGPDPDDNPVSTGRDDQTRPENRRPNSSGPDDQLEAEEEGITSERNDRQAMTIRDQSEIEEVMMEHSQQATESVAEEGIIERNDQVTNRDQSEIKEEIIERSHQATKSEVKDGMIQRRHQATDSEAEEEEIIERNHQATKRAAGRRSYLQLQVLVTTIRETLLKNPISLAIIVAVPFFLYGCDAGLVNAKDQIEKDLQITSMEAAFFATFMTRVPGMVGALFAGLMANVVGRKNIAVIGGGGFYLVGVAIIFFTSEYAALMVGRALTGLSIGMGLVIGPVYVAEVAPAERRGFLAAFFQVLLILGWAYSWIPSDVPGWRAKLLISAIPCMASTVLLACLPDTPPAIVILNGKLEDAGDTMAKCGAEEGERMARVSELQAIAKIPIHLVTNNEGINAPHRRKRITWYLEDPDTVTGFNRSLLIVAGLFIGQELACEEVNLRYIRPIFAHNGHGHQASRVAAVVLVCIKLIGALLPLFMTNVMGRHHDPKENAMVLGRRRRILLLLSIGTTGFFLAGLGGMMLADFQGRVSHAVSFPLYFVVFIGAEVSPAIGMGAIPWMHGPEAFPLLVRTPFFGLCVAVKLGIRQLFTVRLPLLTNQLDMVGFGYLLLSGIMMISFVLCWVYFRDDHAGKILVDDKVAHRLWSQLAIVDRPHRQNV